MLLAKRLWIRLLFGLSALPLPAHAAATAWVGDAHAASRLIAAEAATGSAAHLDAGLQFRLAPGWHVYWRMPGDAGVAPTIDWTGSQNVADASVAWPAPRRLVVSGLQNMVYQDQVVLPIAVSLEHPGQPARLQATVDYAACANVCVPYHAVLDLPVPAGLAAPSSEAPLIAAYRARVPGDPAASGLHVLSVVAAPAGHGTALAVTMASDTGPLHAPDLFIEGLSGLNPGRPAIAWEADGRRARMLVAVPSLAPQAVAARPLTFTLVDGERAAEFVAVPRVGALPAAPGPGWLAILGTALLGGLVLNAMPCVLPVLSLKLLAVTVHAGAGRRRLRMSLLATAAGVLASFALLAATLMGLQAAGAAVGWGIQFQQPWFLATMAAITALFAASLWDLLPIGLPGLSALARVQSRRPLLDALLTGAFVTLLATPCSAPFVGSAVGFALTRGPVQIAAVFAALGLGMAAPYILVAAVPGLVRLLPRPGGWMDWLRRALGLLLAATAGWLLWVLSLAAAWPAALASAAALLAAVGLLAWRSRHPAGHLGWVAAAVLATAVLVPALLPAEPPLQPKSATAAHWQPFDPAAIPGLIAQGRTVFVDVTAAWCLTCKVNAAGVLDRAPVAARLRGPATVAQRADWTRADPAIAAFLARFGRFGVPLDVVYGPAQPAGIALPELLTMSEVTRALRQAAGPAAAGPGAAGPGAAGPGADGLAAR